MVTFEHERISPTTIRIKAPGGELMYLVEGNDRAALLDTGCGFGYLREYVERLTDKPIIVLLTHGHVDHAMGAEEFDDVYMNHADDYIYVQHGELEFRKAGLTMCSQNVEEDEIIPLKELSSIHQMSGGDTFDLGGLHIDIYDLPGHTKGSVVMLIREERALLLGDACNYRTFLHEHYSTSVQEYRDNLVKFKPQLEGKFDRVYLSHGSGIGHISLIEGVIQVCDDLIAGESDEVPFSFKDTKGFLAKAVTENDVRLDGGIGNITYNKDRILR